MITQETKDFIITVKNNGCIFSVFEKLFQEYIIKRGGINNIRKTDLDEIIKEIPNRTIPDDSFMDIYKLVSANESGRLIRIWTWIAGIASILSLMVSIVNLLRSLYP